MKVGGSNRALLCGPSTSPLDDMRLGPCLALALLVSLEALASPGDACLKYEPEQVTLEGTVQVVAFPSGASSNERNVVLQLKGPICLFGSSGKRLEDRSNTPMRDVRRVVLAFQGASQEEQALTLRHIVVTGTLWRAETGHFSESLAMTVVQFRAAH